MTEIPATDPMVAAIDVFTRQGYDATTVDDIADAADMSRSTFFRRFKSKDDVVFTDHEVLLGRVDDHLTASTGTPLQAVCGAARMVFEHHVRRKEISLARFALLHDVAALRDRELVTSHRYENAFTHFLRSALPDTPQREYVSIAFSAAVVALHNAALRQWLLDPERDLGQRLNSQLRSLTKAFTVDVAGGKKDKFLVAVFDDDSDQDELMAAVKASLTWQADRVTRASEPDGGSSRQSSSRRGPLP